MKVGVGSYSPSHSKKSFYTLALGYLRTPLLKVWEGGSNEKRTPLSWYFASLEGVFVGYCREYFRAGSKSPLHCSLEVCRQDRTKSHQNWLFLWRGMLEIGKNLTSCCRCHLGILRSAGSQTFPLGQQQS